MCPLSIKGHGREIELCFNEGISFPEAIEELENLTNDKKSFFEASHTQISYSGIKLKYNQEMLLEEVLKKLFKNDVRLVKKHCLSRKQIEYSLCDGENICLVIEKSLRSGETVISRGDVIIYGDVRDLGNSLALVLLDVVARGQQAHRDTDEQNQKLFHRQKTP